MNRKIMLVAFVLLAILTIGAVSASDDANELTATEIGGDDLGVDQSTLDDEILGTEDVAAVGSDDGEGDGDGDGEDLHSIRIYNEVETDRDYDDVASYWFNKNFTGTVALLFNDTEVYNETLRADEEIWLTVEDLDLDKLSYGIYNVQFVYSGDEYNDNFTIEETVELTYTFIAYIEDDSELELDYIEYGSNVWYYVRLPNGGTGNFTCILNGEERSLSQEDFYDGYIKFSAEDIACGVNNLTFKYVGDEYPLKTIERSFTTKATAKVPDSIAFDEPLVITVTLPKDANGYLNVYEMDEEYVGYDIDDIPSVNYTGYYVDDWGDVWIYNLTFLTSAKVNNGIGNVSISNLPFGGHQLYVNYTGNYEMEDTCYVRVTPGFTIPDKVWINGTATGEFRLPENYSGKLEIRIGDESKSFDVVNGSATFDLFNLDYFNEDDWWDDEDDYRILSVWYSYTDNENGAEFSGRKYIIIMLLNPQTKLGFDEDYVSRLIVKDYSDYYMSFNLPYSAEGNITVYVDGNYYSSEEISYGDYYITIDVTNLTLGKHEVRFEYSGDDYYASAVAYDSFTLTHVDFAIPEEVTIGKYYWGDSDNSAIVLISDDVAGEVKLLVDGIEKEIKQINSSRTYFNLSDLTLGNHTVTLIYQNGNYPSLNKTGKVEAKYGYDLVLNDFAYGKKDVYAVFPIGATGEVIANIDGKEFRATINENGIARFNITGIPAGEYLSTVTYAGDGKYPAASKTSNLTIEYRIITNFNYYDDYYVADLANYTFDLSLPENATGKLVVYGDYWNEREELISKDLVNGKAQISLEEVFKASGNKFGLYELGAAYTGDDYDIYRCSMELRINGYDLSYPKTEHIALGGTAVYTIKLSGNHTGYFQVWGGKRYRDLLVDNISIVDGVAIIEIPATTLGSHSFRLSYVGNDDKLELEEYYYVGPQNVTLSSEVSGNDDLLRVTLPEDASGVLTAYMSSSKYSGQLVLNTTYKGSVAIINASNIPQGTWALSYFTIKDEKYGTYSFASTSKFNADGFYDYFKVVDAPLPIIPISANLTATAKNIKQGEEAVIDISINANVTGKVFIGDKVVDIKGGKGIFKIPNLPVGTYTYTVSFAGDLFFINANVTVSFKVLTDPKIVASDATVQYSAGKYYSVKVFGEDGKAVSGKSVVFVLNGKKIATATTGADGVAKFKITQPPVTKGNLVITALGKSVTKKLTIKHIVTLYSTTFKKSAKKITFKAKLAKVNGKVLKKKTITFKVNGKKVATAKTDKNGVAKITLKDAKATKVLKTLKAGKKVTYQAVYSKDVVQKATKAKK